MADGITVCVGNYGYYAEGELRDAWIELPKTEEQIRSFLEDNGLYDAYHEEIYISDYDGYPLEGCEDLFTEHTRLEDLNLMATQLACMSDFEVEAAAKYISNQGSSMTMHEAMNVLLQADEVGFYDYGWGEYSGDDMVYKAIHDSASPEMRFGYMLVEENPELKAFIESDPCISGAFDIEEYGRQVEMASDVVLYEDGYLDKRATEIDFAYYNERDLIEQVIENATREPGLEKMAESLQARLTEQDIREVVRDLWGGKGYYNPEKSCIVASFVADRPHETAYRFGMYEGLFASPERVSALAGADIDLADYCRDNHLLTPIDDAAWDKMAPELADDRSGWYHSEPDVMKTVLGTEKPQVPAKGSPMPTRHPMPSQVKSQGGSANLTQDAARASQAARTQAKSAPQQERSQAAAKSV